jgi:hypothetical protein
MRAKEGPEGTFFSRPNEASDEGFAEKRTTEIREYFTRGFRPRCSDVDEPRDRVSHEEP